MQDTASKLYHASQNLGYASHTQAVSVAKAARKAKGFNGHTPCPSQTHAEYSAGYASTVDQTLPPVHRIESTPQHMHESITSLCVQRFSKSPPDNVPKSTEIFTPEVAFNILTHRHLLSQVTLVPAYTHRCYATAPAHSACSGCDTCMHYASCPSQKSA